VILDSRLSQNFNLRETNFFMFILFLKGWPEGLKTTRKITLETSTNKGTERRKLEINSKIQRLQDQMPNIC